MLVEKIRFKKASVGVIGLGYVGLPLVMEFCKAGFLVTGFDTDPGKIKMLREGKSYIGHISAARIGQYSRRFIPTHDFSKLCEMDCIVICVPTPLRRNKEPDMSHVFKTAKIIAKYLCRGQLITLESTTYPGTTSQDFRAILERGGLRAGRDFYLAFSPEREDPNNKNFSTSTIPKVVGGYTKKCLSVARALYDTIVPKTIPVSSPEIAEAAKLLENIYRAVNIALVNELKMLFDRMGIDVWEVIDAAKTKPFGFQAFYPGPGLGGHCIPIDPFYLAWKAREFGFDARFIKLAGEINTSMPNYVIRKLIAMLKSQRKKIKNSRVLILGMAYKKDIDDQRESPALKVVQLLRTKGAKVEYSDPHVPVCRGHRHYSGINMCSVELNERRLKRTDAVVLLTDHEAFDYALIEKHAPCILDARNTFARHGIQSPKIWRA